MTIYHPQSKHTDDILSGMLENSRFLRGSSCGANELSFELLWLSIFIIYIDNRYP